MERLTMKMPGGYESVNPVDLRSDEYSSINFKQIVERLGQYEDAEERALEQTKSAIMPLNYSIQILKEQVN